MRTSTKLHLCPSRTGLILAVGLACGSLAAPVARANEDPVASASAALGRGDVAAAESLLAPVTGSDAADPAGLAVLAQIRLRQGRAAEAVNVLERAITLAPNNARLHAALGAALAQRMPEAALEEQPMLAARMLEVFQTAVALDPNLIDARVGLSRYYTQAPEIAGGSRARAEEQARFIVQRVPWLGEAELGQIALRFDDFAAAGDHLAKADELNPNQPWIIELRGHAAARVGDFTRAREHYQAALAINPGLASARQALDRLPPPSAAATPAQ